ncbi:MAG: PHP domain-containing protein [Clostridiales bacterium]|jgi:putative hydrolase|nr:PHP domain-containing protein [Clostridiales bacterium]
MLTEDLHTHTLYSHGAGTVEENVLSAMQKGLRRVGIAEHGPGHVFFGVRYKALVALRREVDVMNDKYGDKIEVLMGLEANLTGDGKTDIPRDVELFDFLMLGFHKGAPPADGAGRRMHASMFSPNKAKYAKTNATNYIHAMDFSDKLINITHPGAYIAVDIDMLAQEAARRNITLELNESHRSMGVEDIKAAMARSARFYLSSDAHTPHAVGRVENSIALARKSGALHCVVNYADA